MSLESSGFQECLNRCLRIEGSITTLASQQFCAQAATTSALAELQRLLSKILLVLPSLPKTPPQTPRRAAVPMSPGPAFPQFCSFCNATHRRGTATASLRHMLACVHCPQGACRYLAISTHMYLFKSAPLVGGPEHCCWCGLDWEHCKSNTNISLSPDARSKHKKMCHDRVHLALQPGKSDPATNQAAKTVLDRIWSSGCVVSPKRSRAEESQSDGPNDTEDGRTESGRAAAAFFFANLESQVFESDQEEFHACDSGDL